MVKYQEDIYFGEPRTLTGFLTVFTLWDMLSDGVGVPMKVISFYWLSKDKQAIALTHHSLQ